MFTAREQAARVQDKTGGPLGLAAGGIGQGTGGAVWYFPGQEKAGAAAAGASGRETGSLSSVGSGKTLRTISASSRVTSETSLVLALNAEPPRST